MFKLAPQFLEGLKFIRISELPSEQSQSLMSWLSRNGLLTLSVDGIDMEDCVDYDDYDYWYRNYLRKELSADF